MYVNHLKDLHDTAIKISPLPLYNELNSFETINDNQYFFIKSENDSIVYFDSFDKNSKVYISESRQKKIFENDIRINGKFHKIEPGVIYFIKNQIFGTSVFKKYFYPLDLDEVEIDINGDEKNFFYLVQNKNYIFNFKKSDMNKMIKLSSKTLDSRVKIIKNGGIDIAELHKDSPYYTLDKNYEGNLELEVYDDHCPHRRDGRFCHLERQGGADPSAVQPDRTDCRKCLCLCAGNRYASVHSDRRQH